MHSNKNSNEPNTKNRGVNVTSKTLSDDDRQLENVEEYIKETINTMGPTTPQLSVLTNNNDTDADNDESIYTNASVYASYTKIKGPTARVIMSSKESEYTVTHDSQDTQRDVTWCSYNKCNRHTCICHHYANHQNYMAINNMKEPPPIHHNSKTKKPSSFSSKFKNFYQKVTKQREPLELYKVNITHARKDESPPRRFVFDLIDDVPKANTHDVATNTKYYNNNNHNQDFRANYVRGGSMHTHKIDQNKFQYVENVPEPNIQRKGNIHDEYPKSRVDVYYFDHGNAAYYRTTDTAPLLMTELLAEKTEIYTARFWAQLFGTVHIGFAFFTSFILQLLRFLLQSLIRPLTVGVTQMFSDYFCKPFLAVTFNGVVQPPMIFFYNIATSIRDVCEPCSESIGCYIREVSVFFRAFRLIEVKKNKLIKDCDCDRIKSPTSVDVKKECDGKCGENQEV